MAGVIMRRRRRPPWPVHEYGKRRCGGCEYLKQSKPWRGEVAMRCANPDNGRRCGWILGFMPLEYAGKIPVLRPVWCSKE